MPPKYISKGKPYQQIAKEKECLACAGSGHYDDDDHGSPRCESCQGTGKVS